MTADVAPPLPPAGAAALFARVEEGLVEAPATPAATVARPELVHLLARLHDRLDGALAIVSGRPVAELDDLVAPLRLTVVGLHGLERRRDDGDRERVVAAPDALARARTALAAFALREPGATLEDHDLALTLDVAGAPARAEAARAAAVDAVAAAGGELEMLEGGGRFDLKPADVDEREAIEALMAEPPFAGRRPVLVGPRSWLAPLSEFLRLRGGAAVAVGEEGADVAASEHVPTASEARARLESWLSG